MIIEEINKANIEALKNKDANAKTILSIVKNKFKLLEIEKRSKGEEILDADCIQILQKTIKELNEEQENYRKVNNNEEINNIELQKNVINKFIPQMMSSDEIKEIIIKLEDKSIPSVMRYFKENYAGKVEMKEVSNVLKSL